MKKTSVARQSIGIYWRYTKRYPVAFSIGSVGSALSTIAQGMVPPFIVSRTFSKLENAYAKHQTLHLASFTPYFIYFTISMVLAIIFSRVQSYAVWQLEENIQRDIANELYDHLQNQSQRFHADRFSGAMVSQTNKFLGSYERLNDDLIWSIIPSITVVSVAVLVLIFISWPYALILLAVSCLYIAIMYSRVKNQLPYNTKAAATESEQTAALADAITNIGTIRAFAGEKYESERFKKITNVRHKAYHKLSLEVMKTEALSQVQTNSFQVLSLFAGLVAVTTYHTNVSLLYLLISYTQNIVNQLWQFSRIVRNVNRSLGDAEEMTNILGLTPEIKDPAAPAAARMPRGEIVFNKVTFAYPENSEDALFKDLSFKIKPGEKVGLVGPSGGGKTTITKLVLRFMSISDGVISIDNQDITTVTQSDLRSHVAYVAQEPILFHRTLAENIGYGNLQASQREIEAIAKMANAHEFISKLPQGYETLVGERGVKLSGGQRQRVAIARAMLKNAPVIILDEATSALDSESEVLIQDALWRLMENKTALVIAHRLSTIQKMDRIIVLEDGAIVEQGSHKELLAINGTYAKLWAHQSGGFMED